MSGCLHGLKIVTMHSITQHEYRQKSMKVLMRLFSPDLMYAAFPYAYTHRRLSQTVSYKTSRYARGKTHIPYGCSLLFLYLSGANVLMQ